MGDILEDTLLASPVLNSVESMSTIAGVLVGVLLDSLDTEIQSLGAEVQFQNTEVRILLGMADEPALRSTGRWKTALPHYGNEISGGMGWGQEFAFFQQTAANFRQRRCLLIISIFPQIPQNIQFLPKVLYF